jgi:hypothetical protein
MKTWNPGVRTDMLWTKVYSVRRSRLISSAFVLLLFVASLAFNSVAVQKSDLKMASTVLIKSSEEKKTTEQSTDNPSSASIRKYVVADLRLGLTNQEVEAWVSLLIAERLNRTLVLPQVRAKIPKGEIVAEENGVLEDFDYVWDSEHFMHCAREKLNKPGLVFATDSHHYDVDIHENDTFVLQQFDGINRIVPLLHWNPARLIKDEFLRRLVNTNASYVKIVKPFAMPHKWNHSECFVPSERIHNMIDT